MATALAVIWKQNNLEEGGLPMGGFFRFSLCSAACRESGNRMDFMLLAQAGCGRLEVGSFSRANKIWRRQKQRNNPKTRYIRIQQRFKSSKNFSLLEHNVCQLVLSSEL